MCYEVELRGCAPEPLMSYLKALGIFRLVSEQKDSAARAWWRNDSFYLSSDLDRDELVEFLLHEYRPTPIVSPWNGGGGFFATSSSKSKEAVRAISSVESDRLEVYRQTIDAIQMLLSDAGIKAKPSKAEKALVLARCRSQLSDLAVSWLDAVYTLSAEDPKFMPLLGTGANDGNMDFTCNFMTNLVPALTGVEVGKRPPKRVCLDERRAGWLDISVFGEGSGQLVKGSVGQFNPGGIGGPNATVGFDGSSLLNPWDYVLMMEGTVLFASAAARRLSAQSSSRAVFPFTVASSMAVSGAFEYGESSRAEFWAPLWDQPAVLPELEQLMFEGRAQLGRRQVSNGTDFARAVVGLGTERGVYQFQRYGFLERYGRTYLATPLGRFQIRHDQEDREIARRANVLFDLDVWMDSLRRNVSGRNAPAGLGVALSQIEGAIFEFCRQGRKEDLQNVLIAVGEAERWLSTSGLRKDNDKGRGIRPLNSLSWDWIRFAGDRSPAFELAHAMASIHHLQKDGKTKVGPIRENMDPVDTDRRPTTWKDDSTSFVWTAGDPLDNMLAVLERRCLEGRMQDLGSAPLASGYSARLIDIVEFLNGEVDLQRITNLALPLSFIRYWARGELDSGRQISAPAELPMAFAVMKMTLLPEEFECQDFGEKRAISMEPRMLSMLKAGRVEEAFGVAWRRLRASGLQPLSPKPGIPDGLENGRRLAAALLFPLDKKAHCALAGRAVMKPQRPES